MPDTDQKSRSATIGRVTLGKVLSVLGFEFLKAGLGGGKDDKRRKRTAKVERSASVTLQDGVTAYGTIRNGVLRLVVLTDKDGNKLELKPEFFDTKLLNLKENVKIPTYE